MEKEQKLYVLTYKCSNHCYCTSSHLAVVAYAQISVKCLQVFDRLFASKYFELPRWGLTTLTVADSRTCLAYLGQTCCSRLGQTD